MIFKSSEKLIDYLNCERETVSLSPIRFVNVDSLSDWAVVKTFIFDITEEHILLSDLCDGDDLLPNIKRMMSLLKKETKSACVLPVSEYLRIFPEKAPDTIKKLLTSEYTSFYQNKFRFYILTYRMRYILEEAARNSDVRKKDSFIFLESAGESEEYSLTVFDKNSDIPPVKGEISGFKRYLRYWEQNPNKPIILRTDAAVYINKDLLWDNISLISSPYDFLKVMSDMPHCLKKDYGSDEEWGKLSAYYKKNISFESMCCDIFNVNKYSNELFSSWIGYNDFMKWLLWLWSKTKDTGGYIYHCIDRSIGVNDFLNKIYSEIINFIHSDLYEEYYLQRKTFISVINITPPQAFFDEIKKIKKFEALKVLTDSSPLEKQTILRLISGLEEYFYEDTSKVLQIVYPMLHEYFSNYRIKGNYLSDDFSSYLKKYKWLKITDNLTSEFNEIVKNLAVEKGSLIYSLRSRNDIISEYYKSNSAIYFVDCLGAEYLNLLCSLLSELEDRFTISYKTGYCNLPSASEFNRDFLSGRKVVENCGLLDRLKHGMPDYTTGIIQEMEFFDGLVNKIEGSFSNDIDRIILTSDHGSSRMAVLVRKTEFDNKIDSQGNTVFEYGRYCEDTEVEAALPTAINYDNYLVLADYSRFTQKGAPTYEIHGGASFEEWLVPVIIIDKKTANEEISLEQIDFTVNLETPIVKKNLKSGKVNVVFSLNPHIGNDVYVVINGEKIECDLKNKKYSFEYKPKLKEHIVHVNLYVNTNVKTFDFRIAKPIAQNSGFDI